MKPKIKHCEFCQAPFVNDTRYNKIACDRQACKDAYCEWVHGNPDRTATCKICNQTYHPSDLLPDTGVCWRYVCSWKEKGIDVNQIESEQLQLFE